MKVSELVFFSCSFLVSFAKGQCSLSWQQPLFDARKWRGSEIYLMGKERPESPGKGLHIILHMTFLSEVFKGKLVCWRENKIQSYILLIPVVDPLL